MRIPASILLVLLLRVTALALPLSFEQLDATHFLARLPNTTAELNPDGILIGDIALRFSSASPSARLEGLGPATPSTYIRAAFVRTLRQYPRVAIRGLYPGVDAIFYANGSSLEYDLQLSRASSIRRIRLIIDGSHGLTIDGAGDLRIRTPSGEIRQMRPRVIQAGREIPVRYVLLGANQVALRLGKHDPRAPITIDPVLSYLKTFGDAGLNSANLVTTDSQGNIYIAGGTNGVSFPTTSESFEPNSVPTLRILSNGGQSVTPLHPPKTNNAGAVGATPDGAILYAGTSQGILHSTDSGSTWQATAPLPIAITGTLVQQPHVNAFSIDSLDPATILVATSIGLYGSNSAGRQGWGQRNGGLNASASGYVSVISVFYNPVNPFQAFAVTTGPSYLYASSDAGNTWHSLNPTYPGETLPQIFPFSPNLAAAITPDGKTLYSINVNGTLLSSPDGGISWVKLASGFAGPGAIQLDPSNPATLYVIDFRGLHKSTDGGVTFANVKAPVLPKSLAVDSTGAVYIVGDIVPVYVSTDGGATFSSVSGTSGLSSVTLSTAGPYVYEGTYSPVIPFVVKLDPSGQNILYSTFLGGSSGDIINGLAVDPQGNAVVAGTLNSSDFPLTVPFTFIRNTGFLAKLNAAGTSLIYSIAHAGPIQAVALDTSGAVFIAGNTTTAATLTTTPNAFQPSVPSIACPRPSPSIFGPGIPTGNGFVGKISSDGASALYETFLTGSCGSNPVSITVDRKGDAVVSGSTTSADFPVSPNTYQSAFPGPVDKTTYPGGVLSAGFVAVLSPAGDKLLAGTYLGGGYSTQATASALDSSGNIYITGSTQGFAPGATPGAYQTQFVDKCVPVIGIGPSPPYTGSGDAFVLKLDPALSSAGFLTYLGGGCNDSGRQIALDSSGNIWVTGTTASTDFPLKAPFQASPISSATGGFVSELSNDGSQLLFSSFSETTALAAASGAVYLGGYNGVSALLAKLDPAKSPPVGIDSVGPVVVFPPPYVGTYYGGVAPGQMIRITGHNLGPQAKVSSQPDASGRLPFILANTLVFFDNISAPLVSVSATEIVCFVPFEAASTAEVTVSAAGQTSAPVLTGIINTEPQVLSIVNQDGTANSAAHPANAGSVITIYATGLGQTNPPGADGLLNASPLPVPLTPITVFFPASPSQVAPQFVAGAVGMAAGITQINVQVPTNFLQSATEPINFVVNSASAQLYIAQ
jgi:uncharacterized protein (TIGR03437 family)